MKSLLLLSLVLSALTVLQGCASTSTSRDPAANAQQNCHDTSTNSEDHHANHCDQGPQ